jgi:uncharacterized protein (DUF1330 family)
MIADVEVTDEEAYREYIKKAPDIIARYGGRYLVRGGAVETIEGNWNPKRLVIEAFDSMEQVKAWLDSPEQREANEIRHRAARTNLIIIEGVDSPAS